MSYGYICEKCFSMQWGETFEKTEYFEIDEETLIPVKTDDYSGDDVTFFCDNCREEKMVYLDLEKEEMKRLLGMDEKAREKWLARYKILENLK